MAREPPLLRDWRCSALDACRVCKIKVSGIRLKMLCVCAAKQCEARRHAMQSGCLFDTQLLHGLPAHDSVQVLLSQHLLPAVVALAQQRSGSVELANLQHVMRHEHTRHSHTSQSQSHVTRHSHTSRHLVQKEREVPDVRQRVEVERAERAAPPSQRLLVQRTRFFEFALSLQ